MGRGEADWGKIPSPLMGEGLGGGEGYRWRGHEILGLLLLLLVVAGCAVERGKIYVKDGKQYGVIPGMIWREQWWNYYERGSSYAEGEFWPDAMADFQAAIRQREADQRQARTYGLHFLDYFPHRELGIVYYRLGRPQDAIRELETSLRAVDTARAKFYLNRARQVLFEQTRRDTPPPRLVLDGPLHGLVTNRFSVAVKGRVESDAYVAGVAIGGRPLFIELAEPHISFVEDVALQDGLNSIEIVTVDLLGRLARQRLTVHFDRAGPLVSVGRVALLGAPPRQRVLVEGSLYDRSRVVRFQLAGREVPPQPEDEWEFREEVDLAPGMAAIPFEVEDAAGNVTRGDIALSTTGNGEPAIRKGEPALPSLPRWAFLHPGAVVSDLPAFVSALRETAQGNGRSPPAIKVAGLTAQQTVHYDTLYLEGQVSGARAITAFTINGESRWRKQSRQIFFNHLASLRPGDNPFLLEAADELGHTARHEIRVTRQVAEVKRLDARLRVILLPLAKKGRASPQGEAVDDHLFNAFVNQRRFDLVERQQLEAILRELKLSQTDLVDPATAGRVGKIAAAEGMLTGAVTETPQALEVFARFVDMETSVVLAAEDVYGEDLTARDVRTLMEGLAGKFRQRLPLVEGLVLKTEGRSVFVDLSHKQAIKKYMKMVLFREGEALKHPVTGKLLGAPTEILGEARVEAVFDELSQATLLQPAPPGHVKPLDKAITK